MKPALFALGCLTGLVIYALPDLRAWARGEPPVALELESCRAEVSRVTSIASRYAEVISACLNGPVTLTVSDGPVAECRSVKGRK